MPTEGNFNVGVPQMDPSTLAWVAAVVANGGSVSASRTTVVDALIKGLRADALFPKLDRLWLHAGENAASALTDIIADSLAVAVNTPTFTVDQGYTFDGATNYINTLFVPSVGGYAHIRDSCSVGSYTRTAPTFQLIGTFGSDTNVCQIYYNAGFVTAQTYGDSSVIGAGNPVGMYIATRTAADQQDIYQNGASFAGNNAPSAHAVSDFSFFISAINSVGTPVQYGASQIAATFIGGGMSATDAANISARINTYMAAIGASVY